MFITKENNEKDVRDETFAGVIMGFVVGVLASVVIGGVIASIIPTPTLMGIGCENTSGPIFAKEEDHFPLCQRIESL